MTKALEFTLSVSSCLKCGMCPQDKLAVAYTSEKRRMTMDDVRKILSTVPTDVDVHAGGFSEPFLNPICGDFLLYAGFKGHKVWLYSTLVGMSQGQSEMVKTAKPYAIRIHVPDSKHFLYPTDKWLVLFNRFLGLDLPYSAMTMDDLLPDMEQELERRGVVVVKPQMLSRASNLGWSAPNYPLTGKIKCQAEREKMNVVLPNGDVIGCSMMYSCEIKLGNLYEQTYSEIDAASDKWIQEFTETPNSPCSRCEWCSPA